MPLRQSLHDEDDARSRAARSVGRRLAKHVLDR
jgi:hypothetical protein